MNKCGSCGQPLPQIMTCEEWKKAGEDLVAQVMQPGGLIKLNLPIFLDELPDWAKESFVDKIKKLFRNTVHSKCSEGEF